MKDKAGFQSPFCAVCNGPEEDNPTNEFERFLICAACNYKYHPTCTQLSPAVAAAAASKGWQCLSCKACILCSKPDNDDRLIFCDGCDRGFHSFCLDPPLKKIPEGDYLCLDCKGEGVSGQISENISETPVNISKRSSRRSALEINISISPQKPVGISTRRIKSSPQTRLSNNFINKSRLGSISPSSKDIESSSPEKGSNKSSKRKLVLLDNNSEYSDLNGEIISPSKIRKRNFNLSDDEEEDEETSEFEEDLLVEEEDDEEIVADNFDSDIEQIEDKVIEEVVMPILRKRGRPSKSNSQLNLADPFIPKPEENSKAAVSSNRLRVRAEIKADEDEEELVSRPQRRQTSFHPKSIIETQTPAANSSSYFLDSPKSAPTARRGRPKKLARLSTGRNIKPKNIQSQLNGLKKSPQNKSNRSRSHKKGANSIMTDKLTNNTTVKIKVSGKAMPLVVRDRWAGVLAGEMADSKSYCPTEEDVLFFNSCKLEKTVINTDINVSTIFSTPAKTKKVQIGKWLIDSWYNAPYPEEYSQRPMIFLCEFCLKYMKDDFGLHRHKSKCPLKHPPGVEIYRNAGISVFEVDGKKNKIYCQNLCLLAKMFLDHKTLYYDVEPFLFYIMTENDDTGFQFAGYFSKEKRSSTNYNLSCIVTLPVHQRKGYGNFLIDFSYLLSRKEGKQGTPEKPLSDLGLLSYRNYWKRVILEEIYNSNETALSIEDISVRTSLTLNDIASTLSLLDLVSEGEERDLQILFNRVEVGKDIEKFNAKGYPRIDPSLLVWTPMDLSLLSTIRTLPAEVDEEEEIDGDDEDDEELIEDVDDEEQIEEDQIEEKNQIINS